MSPQRLTAALSPCLAIVLLAACNGDDAGDPAPPATPSITLSSSPPSASPSAAPADTAATASKKALVAYRGMWRTYEAAIKIPDPSYPALRESATGNALDTLVKGLEATKRDDLRGTGKAKLEPRVTKVSPLKAPTEASIEDCLDDRGTRVVRATPGGTPYKDEAAKGQRLVLATAQRQIDGVWKISSFGVRGVGSC